MLTVQQRLETYQWAKDNFETHEEGPYLCNVLEDYVERILFIPIDDRREQWMEENLPEFWAFKPPYITHYNSDPWWEEDNMMSRSDVLYQCIRKCEQIIQNI